MEPEDVQHALDMHEQHGWHITQQDVDRQLTAVEERIRRAVWHRLQPRVEQLEADNTRLAERVAQLTRMLDDHHARHLGGD